MFQKISLQLKLIGSFLSIVIVVALIGWMGVSSLNQHIQTLGNNTLPSVVGLWKINEGQTQIQSSERFLLNPDITDTERQQQLQNIQEAWKQINEGFQEYEPTEKTSKEKKLYQVFLQDWKLWKTSHENYLKLETEYHQAGIRNPWEYQLKLLTENSINPNDLLAVEKVLSIRQVLEEQEDIKRGHFNVATQNLLNVLEENQIVGDQVYKNAMQDVSSTSRLMIMALIISPILTIVIGRFLSLGITKPIFSSINLIATSSSQISATIEQQEKILAQQAASVSETTATIDELGMSSRQTAQKAESASENASQVFELSQEGITIVQQTLKGITNLQQKVETIAQAIKSLSEKIIQINKINALVADIANQTNMLALNASVEAVRAGEAGKGFAIVASAIRQLADESKGSAEKINILVNDIQKAISSTVTKTEEGKTNADQGINLSQKTAAAFKNMAEAINEIMISNQQIAMNVKQQAKAIEQVVMAMNMINQGSQQTVLGVSQTKDSILQLNEAARYLKRLSGS